jgi:hypothetical protein
LIAPVLWGMILLAWLSGAPARADDPTFRELQQTPSPQDLMRRLTGLPLPPLPLRGQGTPDGAPGEESNPLSPGFSPTLPPNTPPWAKESLEDFRRSAQPLQENDDAPRPGEANSIRGTERGNRSQENAASQPQPGRSERTTNRRNAVEPPGNDSRSNGPSDLGSWFPPNGPASRRSANENRAAESAANRTLQGNGESFDAPQARSRASEDSPTRRDNTSFDPRKESNFPGGAENSLPPAGSRSPSANPPPTPDRRASQPRRALKTRKEFNDKMNRILLEAARRAANEEPSKMSQAAAQSRDALFNPLLKRVETLLKDRSLRRQGRAWFNRHVRRGPARDLARRLDKSFDFPDDAGAEISVMSVSSLAATPVLLIVLAVLLAPVVNRLRPRLAAYLQAAALAPFRVLRLESNEELVRAVDQFLARRFGRASSWWHCRAVERALADLAPHLSDEIARLAAAYEVARYGPTSHRLAPDELEQSAGTLRRLAEVLLAPEFPNEPRMEHG